MYELIGYRRVDIEAERKNDRDTHGYSCWFSMDENDPDYGFVILKVIENGGEVEYASVDDEETLQKVYAIYMEEVFSDEDEAE